MAYQRSMLAMRAASMATFTWRRVRDDTDGVKEDTIKLVRKRNGIIGSSPAMGLGEDYLQSGYNPLAQG